MSTTASNRHPAPGPRMAQSLFALLVVLAVIGFGPSYINAVTFSGKTFTLLVHAHGALMALWLVYPAQHVVELRSLKLYIFQLRDVVVSYERLINVVYDHLTKVCDPLRLRVVMICNPRGGISSRLTIDSDWKVRGGKEEYKDWQHGSEDTWSVIM